MIRVLFVYLGNICRWSRAYFGTLSIKAALNRGFDLNAIRARKVVEADFADADYVIAMDSKSFEALSTLCPEGYGVRIYMFLNFAATIAKRDVPDFYYHGGLDTVLRPAGGCLGRIVRNHPRGAWLMKHCGCLSS